MANETIMGGFLWRLGVKSTVKEDLKGAKDEVNGFDDSINGASDSLMTMDAISKQNARDVRQMSSGVAIAGGMLLGLSASAKQAGVDLGTILDVSTGVGLSMMMVGTTISSITPLMKAYATFQSSELVASIGSAITAQTAQTAVTIEATGAEIALAAAGYTVSPSMIAMAEAETVATAATITLSGALTVLAGATIVGAVVIGAYLIYDAWNRQRDSAAALEKEIKTLNQTTSELRYIQTAAEEKTKGLKDALDRSGDAVKNLEKDYDDLNTAMGKQLSIADRLRHAPLEIADATQALRDANKDLVVALRSGDPDEIKRAKNRKNNAKEALDDANRNLTAINEEKKANDEVIAKAPGLATSRVKAADDAAKAQDDYNKQLLKQEEIENRIKKNDFYAKLAEWQKAGVVLSSEDIAAYTSKDAPAWMRSGYADYASKYKNITPGIDILETIHKTLPETGGLDPLAGGAYLNRGAMPNPMLANSGRGDVYFQITGTFANEKFKLTNEQKAALTGYKS